TGPVRLGRAQRLAPTGGGSPQFLAHWATRLTRLQAFYELRQGLSGNASTRSLPGAGAPLRLSGNDGEDGVLGHDEILLAVERHFAARVVGEQHAVADLHLELGASAVVKRFTLAQREDLALLGLLLGGVRQDDPADRLLVGLQALDHNLVVQR